MATAMQTAHLMILQLKLAIDSNTLAWHWGIPLHKAKRTVKHNTRFGKRNIVNLTIVRRFCNNNHMLRYHRLHHNIFTNIMFASILSIQCNKCAQIFSSNFGWLPAYPMKTKGEAHDALSLMFQHEGVPPLMVIDGLKEQTLGKFHQKLRDSDCEKVTEPYSPWQNAAKREIKELKKGTGRKLLLTNTPGRLWDDCLEY